MRRSKSDHNDKRAQLEGESKIRDSQHSRTVDALECLQRSGFRAGSPKGDALSPGVTPSAQSLVAEALHGQQTDERSVESRAHEGARTTRDQARGGAVARPSGGSNIATHMVLGVDVRLWLICVYAFLVAINNTSLRPVLPSFVKARPLADAARMLSALASATYP